MRSIILFILMVLIIGCANQKPDYVITTEYKYVTYQLPTKLVSSCTPTKPTSIKDYSTLTLEERETYLANYSISLLGDIKKCDNKIKSIVKYIDEINKMSGEGEVPKSDNEHERGGNNGN